MSTEFTVWCLHHDVAGPTIRRSAGGVALLDADPLDPASVSWGAWLIDHEWCPTVLSREGSPPGPHSQGPRDADEAAEWLAESRARAGQVDQSGEVGPPGRAAPG